MFLHKRINTSLCFTLLWGLIIINHETTASVLVSTEVKNEIENTDSEAIPTTTLNSLSENVTEFEIGKNYETEEKDKPFLLPETFQPVHYTLQVIPLLFEVTDEDSPYFNLSRFSAPGRVLIKLKCLQDSDNITLHAHKDVAIDKEKIKVVSAKSSAAIQVKNVSRDNDTDFLVIHLENPIIFTNESDDNYYTLYIEFVSRIADDRLNGMYLDYYIDPQSKEKRYLSTTLFAPNHARKSFPNFDEPRFKAKFNISLGRKRESGYTSISNMPLSTTTPMSEIRDWVWDNFEETIIPIPTYIVAMITTDFTFRSIRHSNIEIRLYAPDYLLQRTQMLNVTNDSAISHTQNPYLLQDPLVFIASALEMWKGTGLGSYTFPKLDIVALPHFFFNAMENMGAITFKYPVILNVKNTTTTRELLQMNYVAGHEIVHQWFGNMLTPKSWTYVWLKESFSDLFSRIFISEMLDKTYNNEDLILKELQAAMKFDGGPESHPLENEVKTASSVGEIYTHIPYKKGASVMHMTRFFLTKKTFTKGLELLFQNRKFSNIDQNDLFHYLDEAYKLDENKSSAQQLPQNVSIPEILNTWTKQSCYPVVRMRREGSNIILSQGQYQNGLMKLLNKSTTDEEVTELPIDNKIDRGYEESGKENSRNEPLWWIPIKLCQNSDGEATNATYSIKWLPPIDNETIILNADQQHISNAEGYFRILYSQDELHSILKRFVIQNLQGLNGFAKSPLLRPVERSQLLDDYFTFAFSNYEDVPIQLFFHIASNILSYEKEYVVWSSFLTNLKKPYQLLQKTEYYPSLQKYLLGLLRPLYSFLQSQKLTTLSAPCTFAPAVTKRLKFLQFNSLVYSWMCTLEADECYGRAYERVLKDLKISNDEQEATFCAAVKSANDEKLVKIWSHFEKLYFDEYYSVQRDRYSKALTCTNQIDYLRKVLSWTTNETMDLHDIDRVTLLKQVISNPAGRELVLDFLDENFPILYKSASVANPVTESLKAYVDYVNTAEKISKMEEFIQKHSDAMESKKKFLQKQVKAAKLNVLWMETFAEDFHNSVNFQLENNLKENAQLSCPQETEHDLESYAESITDYKQYEVGLKQT